MARITYTIPQRESGTGSIHDISSTHHSRDIVFAPGCKYAVVLASYYGGKGYTTHRTSAAAIRQSRKLSRDGFSSHEIIDYNGVVYDVRDDYYDKTLVPFRDYADTHPLS